MTGIDFSKDEQVKNLEELASQVSSEDAFQVYRYEENLARDEIFRIAFLSSFYPS